MASRGPTPGAHRLLEWGQQTEQPGSQVRDAAGHKVFTGAPVRPKRTAGVVKKGTVTALHSPTTVDVHWAGATQPVTISASELITLAELRGGEWTPR